MSLLRRKTLRVSSRKLALRPRVNLMSSVRKPGYSILYRLVRMLRLKETKDRIKEEKT